MEGISLDSAALGQLQAEQKELLDTIDDLRKHGVDRFVDLPQIIVVGDQSSGKSSVLEAISRVRFPVRDGLCTRFATELVLRADTRTKVDVTIQPSPSSNQEVQPFSETDFDKDELPRIIEDAKRRMLVDGAGFSEDVLRIEIRGPNLTQLTLVDLPGFYHSEDENQSAAGRQVVDRLAERYMSRKNSIILAIVSARNQVILQKVLSKVKEHDRNTERTLGIITKPDLLTPGSQDEESFVRLAKNADNSHKLSRGWHLLRNRGQNEQECTHEERDNAERDFFTSGPWPSIPASNRGIDSLRAKLSKTLLQHIKDNLPGLIQGIEEQLSVRLTRLRQLGSPRSTPDELRSYLDRIASQFEKLSRNAVEGNYSDEFFGGLYPDTSGRNATNGRVRKLRALVRDLNRSFAYILETKGSSCIVLPRNQNQSSDEDVPETPDVPQYLQILVDQYRFEDPRKVSFEAMSADLENFSSENQGTEFPGTSNDRIAVKLFQYQSGPWEEIARFHLKLVLDTVKAFAEVLLENIIGTDSRTLSTIMRDVVHPFFDQKTSELENKLKELLLHYKSGYPQPLDADFRSGLATRRRKNQTEEAMQYLSAHRPDILTDAAREELRTLQQPTPTGGFGVEGLIDKAETYYEMSLRTFTDNVIILAIENCLVRDLPNVFTTRAVNRMKRAELEQLASESPEIQVERDEVQREYDSLNRGLEACNRYRDRPMTLPSVLAAIENMSLSRSLSRSPAPETAANRRLAVPSPTRPQATSPRTPDSPSTLRASGSSSTSGTPRQNSPAVSSTAAPAAPAAAPAPTPAAPAPTPAPTRQPAAASSSGTGFFGRSTQGNISNPSGFPTFGASTTTAPRAAPGLFGTSTSTNAPSTSNNAPFGGFGASTTPSRNTSGGFGSSSLFATSTPNTAPSSSGFGLFGGSQPPAQATQTQQQQQQQPSLFGNPSTPAQRSSNLPSSQR